MKKILLTIVLGSVLSFVYAQGKSDTWNEFAKTKFEPKYYEKLGEYIFYPNFPAELKAQVGKEITVKGFYVPFAPEDGNYIIISKYPMSQCFFCGGGGPESIAEVTFAKDPGKFQVDDLITVRGKLQLNADDVDHVNFILKDAVLVK
ncbi:hypothetical protein [Chryseosolibacter indicus]|uniref:DUF3299 domain-containing protein n=1 Tax=Chryseosolibacter indicus TaxID=2782351 RepID=A0ABS5VS49_9BACT|nr:hypothetical protein [Chryseosolibacter indicus]MBT1704006.1 hypothetical protein [Chryseosolibacter indicus]